MPTKNTIRTVFTWASTMAPKVFTPRDAAGVIPLSYRTIHAALEALEDLDVVEEGPAGWIVTGNAEKLDSGLMRWASEELEKATGLRPIERVRDVFEYAERCALAGS